MRIEFDVVGIPPKKDGANSMWNKEDEVKKIISLLQVMLKALKKGSDECIRDFVRLEMELNIPRHQMK